MRVLLQYKHQNVRTAVLHSHKVHTCTRSSIVLAKAAGSGYRSRAANWAHLASPFVRPNKSSRSSACSSTAQLDIPPLWSHARNFTGQGSVLIDTAAPQILGCPKGPRSRTLACACVRCGFESTVAEADGPLAHAHDVKTLPRRSLRRLLAGTLFPGCVRHTYSCSS